MTEADAYCITIMHQVQAVQRAIDAFNTALLEAYLADTVTSTIWDAPEKERKQVIGELLAVFQRNEESKPVVPQAATSEERIPQRIAWLTEAETRLRDVRQVVEAGENRVRIMQEMRAIHQLLTAFNERILEDHLNSCVVTAITSDHVTERERVIQELLTVFDATQRIQ
jgi:DNA-binding FrmR family transcriptional regulator